MKKQKENQAQTKSVGSNLLIVILILITLATSAFGIFAWARYQTSVQGEGTAQVARWNFKVTGDSTQTDQVVFAVTRDDENTTVADGTIAPGTSGKIEMTIDVTGTQTDLIYTISGSTVNMPRNLKLYTDEARTKELAVLGQQFSKGNYLKLSDIGTGEKIIPETIYWEWPFETGATAEEKINNNKIDTEDMGKAMTIAIKVEGKQLNGAPALADLVQVGDYVNYDANSGDSGVQTFTSDNCLEGTIVSGTISTADNFDYDEEQTPPVSQWRVLNVNRQTKEVELISIDPTKQTIEITNENGFKNAKTVLDNIGIIYGQGKGAISGRSLTIEDIEKYSNYDKTIYESPRNIKYGETRTYTVEGNRFYIEKTDEQGKVIGYETTLIEANEENPVIMTETYYSYNGQYYFTNPIIYNMVFNNSTRTSRKKSTYWLASYQVDLYSTGCVFGLRGVSEGYIGGYGVFGSGGNNNNNKFGMIPVVSLEGNIQTTGQVDGVWQLKVD